MGILKKLGITVAALFIVVVLLITQPWSDYPASGMLSVFNADTRSHNFRNMDELLPGVAIAPSTTPTPYPVALAPQELMYDFDGETRSVSSFLERTEGTSLLIIKDGTIVQEEYLNGAEQTSRHTSWSVAKSFVSTLIGIARDEGLINSVEDKVSQYLPELEGSAYGAARVKDLLQMSSGVDFTESYGAAGGNTVLATSSVQVMLNKAWILGFSLDGQLAGYAKLEEPGTRFYYRSSDTHVLSAILRRIYNKPFEDILDEKLWQPLGMTSNASWNTAADIPVGFCCLNATSRDYAKLGSLFLNNGNWHGKQIVSKKWVDEATIPSSSHVQPENARGNRGYQYQWWVPKDYDGEFFANGIWGQSIWVSRKHNMVIVTTATDPKFRANMTEKIAVMRAINASFDTEG